LERNVFDELIEAFLKSNEDFSLTLRSIMKRMNISIKKLSQETGIPLSTLNKILNESRDIRISTLRAIISYFRKIERTSSDIVIGIIASRSTLDNISKKQLLVKGKKVLIKEYPASNIEDAIISAIKAECDRVDGIICAPIIASIIEKFIKIPIVTIKIKEENIIEPVEKLIEKIISYETKD
jgi:predicted transcriptional regulator